MSQKFGGKYSNDPEPQPKKSDKFEKVPKAMRREHKLAVKRSKMLSIAGFVAIIANLTGGADDLVLGLITGAAFFASTSFLQQGLKAEGAYLLDKFARRPAIPRKIIAALLAGVGVTAGCLTEADLLASLFYGICAIGLHGVTFGIDPLHDKQVEGVDDFQQDRVSRVVKRAEDYISDIENDIASLRDRHLKKAVYEFTASARTMIACVEEDPRDLTAARKFLSIYLKGARDATTQFITIWERSRDTQARHEYEALLTDLQGNFAAKSEKLLLTDRSDFDVEIKVLRDRLQREGIYQKDDQQ